MFLAAAVCYIHVITYIHIFDELVRVLFYVVIFVELFELTASCSASCPSLRMSDLVWPISFGSGVGIIKLGTNVADFINKTIAEGFPRSKVNIISAAPEELFTVGTSVDLVDLGILCHFHPKTEKLILIMCYDLTKVSYDLKGLAFGLHQGIARTTSVLRNNSNSYLIPHLEMIHKALGPSFPGKFIDNLTDASIKSPNNSTTHPYLLTLNGISFLFSTFTQQLGGDTCSLSKMFIYPVDMNIEQAGVSDYIGNIGAVDSKSNVIRSTKLSSALMPSQIKNNVLVNLVNSSVDSRNEHPYSYLSFPSKGTVLQLGMSPQDVISILQSPDIVSTVEYPPSNSKTSSGGSGSGTGTSSCTHWRYHYLGLELFFSATHVLFRIVCRNNLCPHADFCLFHRCPFFLQLPSAGVVAAVENSADTAAASVSQYADTEERGGKEDASTGVLSSSSSSNKKKKKEGTKLRSTAAVTDSHTDADMIAFFDSWEFCLSLLKKWFNSSEEVVHESSAIRLAPDCSPYLPTKLFAYPEVSGWYFMLPCVRRIAPDCCCFCCSCCCVTMTFV